jgi:hypothetical protein
MIDAKSALLMVKLAGAGGLVLPATSVAVTLMVCTPLGKGLEVQLQLPSALLVVAQSRLPPPSFTVIVLVGCAVPLIVGLLLVEVLRAVGPVMMG